MKKHLLVAGLMVTVFIIGCESKDTDNYEYSDTSKESSMSSRDNTETMPLTVDSSTTSPLTGSDSSTMGSMQKATPDPAKKGKKGKVSIVVANTASGDISVDKEGYYNSTEILPGYPGGEKALERFYNDNIQYPVEASDNGVDGIVKINFAVDENGKLYAPVVTSPVIGYGIEQEALRVFNKMPKWTPGRIKGKNVKTRFSLPVNFQLQ